MDRLNRLPFAPIVGIMFGLVAAILVIATPHWLFEHAVSGSGLPSLLSAATPPLGDKARISTALVAAASIGLLVWLGLARVEKLTAAWQPLSPPAARGHRIVRTALEKPRPIFAQADLGAPFMSEEAMKLGLEELVLEPAMIEAPAPVAAVPSAAQSVGAMLSRLEDAVERRKARLGNIPPVPGDRNALRSALGIAA